MHNVKRFLQESTFEPSADARARATARPEDMIPIYRKRTAIDAGGRESESQIRYAVVDGVEALAKLGGDAPPSARVYRRTGTHVRLALLTPAGSPPTVSWPVPGASGSIVSRCRLTYHVAKVRMRQRAGWAHAP